MIFTDIEISYNLYINIFMLNGRYCLFKISPDSQFYKNQSPFQDNFYWIFYVGVFSWFMLIYRAYVEAVSPQEPVSLSFLITYSTIMGESTAISKADRNMDANRTLGALIGLILGFILSVIFIFYILLSIGQYSLTDGRIFKHFWLFSLAFPVSIGGAFLGSFAFSRLKK